MKTISETITPHFAAFAFVNFHPLSVAVFFKFVLPNLPEAVVIDISLMVVAADAQAARYRAVGQHRRHVDACAARIIMVSHLAFVSSEEAVAAVVGTDLAFETGLFMGPIA